MCDHTQQFFEKRFTTCMMFFPTRGHPAHIQCACRFFILEIFKGSAWVPVFAGSHASGSAGQHELFDSILGRVKKVTAHNHSLRVHYVR